MKVAILLVCLLGLIAAVRGRHGQSRGGGKSGHGPNRQGGKSNSNSDFFNDILNIIYGSAGDTSGTSLSFGSENGHFVIESNLITHPPAIFTETPIFTDPTSTIIEETHIFPDEEEVIEIEPWRGEGSFTGDVRILCNGRKPCRKGPVQVYNKEKERWGFICGDGWGVEESNVVCKYLQFSRGSNLQTRFDITKIRTRFDSMAPIVWKDINCTGTETGIITCGGSVFKNGDICDKNKIAGAKCRGPLINTDTIQTCDDDQFACGNGAVCLPLSYECDELADCPWGTDEVMCSGNMCPDKHFDCGSGGTEECVISAYRCDGDDDCGNGNDEDGCADHLIHFTKFVGEKIRHGIKSGWRYISAYSCAQKCREETDFACVAFMYNKAEKECDLSTIADHYPRYNSIEWTTYVLDSSVCDGFQCGSRCLLQSQVCDGVLDCFDYSDEDDCSLQLPIELRIAGGPSPSEGQLQARFGDGNWGLVCDLGWSINEANVACRQLGYRYGAVNEFPGMSFRRSDLSFSLSGVDCTGTENSLNECDHDGSYLALCRMDHDAGIECRDEAPQPSTTPTIAASTTTQSTVSTTTAERPLTTIPSTSQCGIKPSVPHLRIVGGSNANAHEFPWQAGIWIKSRGKQFFTCGGTIISSCWILTAAHCFIQKRLNSQYIIRLGDHFADPTTRDTYQVDFKVESISVNGGYNKATNDNDIALIKLKRGESGECADLSKLGLGTACLPTSNSQFTARKECVITGWGQLKPGGKLPYTPQLQKANVELIDRRICEGLRVYEDALTENMFCAGELKGGIDTCQGDSGGPLSCEQNNAYYVWGIVSWGHGCARPNAPGIYTVVANYLSWIGNVTGTR